METERLLYIEWHKRLKPIWVYLPREILTLIVEHGLILVMIRLVQVPALRRNDHQKGLIHTLNSTAAWVSNCTRHKLMGVIT